MEGTLCVHCKDNLFFTLLCEGKPALTQVTKSQDPCMKNYHDGHWYFWPNNLKSN